MSLVLHPTTAQHVENFIARPGHAVILVGPKGVGKYSVAEMIAEKSLRLENQRLHDYPYAMIISAEGKTSIGIEAVRELEMSLKLKVPNSGDINRVVIIDGGQALGVEAQNALLKTLEEPPVGTLLIITAQSDQDLLPTIMSRGQKISIRRPAVKDLQVHFSNQSDEQEVKKALAMTGGLPGLTQALLVGDEHPLQYAVTKARELLSQSTYDRLLQVDELSKQKELAIDTLFILQQMADISLQTATGAKSQQWERVLTASYDATRLLQNSAQPKLVLDDFMLKL